MMYKIETKEIIGCSTLFRQFFNDGIEVEYSFEVYLRSAPAIIVKSGRAYVGEKEKVEQARANIVTAMKAIDELMNGKKCITF